MAGSSVQPNIFLAKIDYIFFLNIFPEYICSSLTFFLFKILSQEAPKAMARSSPVPGHNSGPGTAGSQLPTEKNCDQLNHKNHFCRKHNIYGKNKHSILRVSIPRLSNSNFLENKNPLKNRL